MQADGTPETLPLFLGTHADRLELADPVGLVEPREGVRGDNAVSDR